jgi:hypothetical protein
LFGRKKKIVKLKGVAKQKGRAKEVLRRAIIGP